MALRGEAKKNTVLKPNKQKNNNIKNHNKDLRFNYSNTVNSISRIFLSSFALISFFYIMPLFISFTENNFNTNEFKNNSKNNENNYALCDGFDMSRDLHWPDFVGKPWYVEPASNAHNPLAPTAIPFLLLLISHPPTPQCIPMDFEVIFRMFGVS